MNNQAAQVSITTSFTPPDLPRTLAGFRDFHQGATMLVCGCGASLNELICPERFITIGVNDVGRRFDPTYLVVLNPRNQFSGDRFRYVEQSRAQAIFTQLDLGIPHPHVVRFPLGSCGGTDFSNPQILHYTSNSPYLAMCLAVHLGARRIGLIGVDFTDHHFFAATGRHPLTSQFERIDREYVRLAEACARQGVEVINLSRQSRLTAFPKMAPAAFVETVHPAAQDTRKAAVLSIVSYATTPVAGVPAILARCIRARTPHLSHCVWARCDYGNGVEFKGDIQWTESPAAAAVALAAADVVVVHNGKVDPQHRPLLAGKALITMAHNYLWNVDQTWVKQGFPGTVVGQYQATLPEFTGWTVVPNPLPLWEDIFQPAPKPELVTICYTPSGQHERYPQGHYLYWHGKGYVTTLRVLERLAAHFPLQLEVIRNRQLPHREVLAMKRRSHIVIDECVTGSYHRNSLEGLAAGCVVVNGVGLLPGVGEVFAHCADSTDLPFVHADLNTLETVLAELIAQGPEALAAIGRRNRQWLERHWDFAQQWRRFWEPTIRQALDQAKRDSHPHQAAVAAPLPSRLPDSVSVIIPHGGSERLPLLQATLQNLRYQQGVGEVIVVEMDATAHARQLAGELADKYLFIRHQGVFHKARALNAAIPLMDHSLLLWLDNDLLLPADFLTQAIAELHARRLDCLVPWTSVRYLSARDSEAVLHGSRKPMDCRPVQTYRSRQGACGAAVLVRRDFTLRYGGLCEAFRGWGGEDNAWFYKARLLGHAAITEQLDQHLYHLFHEGSGGYGSRNHITANPHYAANVALLQNMRTMTRPELFLARYPPPSHFSCPWDTDRRIACLTVAEESMATLMDSVMQVFARLYGITLIRGTVSRWMELQPPPEAVVVFGVPAELPPAGCLERWLIVDAIPGETMAVTSYRITSATQPVTRVEPVSDPAIHLSERIAVALVPLLSLILADADPLLLPVAPERTELSTGGASVNMKLNLGCCDSLLEGFVNVDLFPAPGVATADLREPWPWPDNTVEYIRAWDIIEHLPDKIFTMNELWRVLQPNGQVEIVVPTTEGPGAWQDPTHVSFWNRRSFLYYEAGNPYRERFTKHYGIRAKFRVLREHTEQTLDGPRLRIVLQAVKP